MLNACLVERLSMENQFAQLERLLGILWRKSDELFAQSFDRDQIQQLQAEAEAETTTETVPTPTPNPDQNTFSLDTLIDNFLHRVEESFITEYLGQNITNLLQQEIQEYPDFFIAHYKTKIANKLIDQINKFKAEFTTVAEDEWIRFIEEERKSLDVSSKG